MKLALVLTGFFAVLGVVTADYLMVSEVQNAIKATCETHISFDKSGEMYCVDSMNQSVRLGQK